MSKVTIYSPPSAAQVKNCTADFDLRRAPVPIHLVQFDKTIPILAVALYKGGTAYKLPEDAEANVRMGKRNNLYVYNPVLGCNEGRTLVYVAVTPQMTPRTECSTRYWKSWQVAVWREPLPCSWSSSAILYKRGTWRIPAKPKRWQTL